MKKTPSKVQPFNVNNAPQKLAMTVGNVNAGTGTSTKTSGTKIRGTGAAVRGTIARGPMG